MKTFQEFLTESTAAKPYKTIKGGKGYQSNWAGDNKTVKYFGKSLLVPEWAAALVIEEGYSSWEVVAYEKVPTLGSEKNHDRETSHSDTKSVWQGGGKSATVSEVTLTNSSSWKESLVKL